MYKVILLWAVAAASAAPQYLLPEPSPAFSIVKIVERTPPTRSVSRGTTYFTPEQNLKKAVVRDSNYKAPSHNTQSHRASYVTTPAPIRVAVTPAITYSATRKTISVASPGRTYSGPIQVPRVATPARAYNDPTQAPEVAKPVRTYNAPRVAVPARRYNAPATILANAPAPIEAPAPVRTYNAPVPSATYNTPSVRIGAPVVPILRDIRVMPEGGTGEYNFQVETGDGIIRNEEGHNDNGMTQQGGWSFMFPDGTPAVFTFVADKNGFQVQSDLLPVPPPMPAHARAQIEKARLEDEDEARATASAPGTSYQLPRNTYATPQNK